MKEKREQKRNKYNTHTSKPQPSPSTPRKCELRTNAKGLLRGFSRLLCLNPAFSAGFWAVAFLSCLTSHNAIPSLRGQKPCEKTQFLKYFRIKKGSTMYPIPSSGIRETGPQDKGHSSVVKKPLWEAVHSG